MTNLRLKIGKRNNVFTSIACCTNRWNMRSLVAAGKHVNAIRAIARQPPIKKIVGGGVFS
jgi:hypothetical protein